MLEKLRLSHYVARQSPCVPKEKSPETPTDDQWIGGQPGLTNGIHLLFAAASTWASSSSSASSDPRTG